MAVSPAIAELVPDAQRWRRHLHAHPELLYDLDQTAAFVAERLREVRAGTSAGKARQVEGEIQACPTVGVH